MSDHENQISSENQEKVYTIIAGINGAGKTSLYRVLSGTDELGLRINIDEMVMKEGDWKDPLLQVQAGKRAMKLINECIENGVSFHHETTLPGAVIMRQIRKAKENGFKIVLYFVGIDDVKTAIKRVHKRVAMGGHGIDDQYIIKRYSQLKDRLLQILPLCDTAVMFDNTKRFRQIAVILDNKLYDCDRDLPNWFIELIDEIPEI